MVFVKMEKLPKSEVKLIIEVPTAEMKKFSDEAISKLAKNEKVKGFRPGKAPKSMLKEKIGKEKIFNKILEIALPLTYYEAVKLQKIVPLIAPEINIKQFEENKSLVYEAKVAVLPEVKIGDYRKCKIQKAKCKIDNIDDKEIENLLRDLQKKKSTLKPIEREIKKGDWVEIDFKPINSDLSPDLAAKLSSQNFPLIIGQTNFVPGFEDQLIGLKKDETKEFEINFPKKFHLKETAGKKITFFVKINQAQEIILPPLNDEFAQSLGDFKTLLDLKIKLRENLILEKEEQEKERLRSEIIKKIVDLSETEISPMLIKQETEHLISEVKNSININGGIQFEDYLKKINKTEEGLRNEIKKQAEQNIKTSLVLNEISKREEISVTEQEIETELNQMLLSLPGREEEIKNWYNSEEGKRQLINNLIGRKTIDRLVEIMVE